MPFSEPVTGLVYVRNRWYSPGTGTFLAPDPLGYVDSANLYAFAGGDPINGRDPLGLQTPCKNTTLGNAKASARAALGWAKDKVVGFMDAGGRSTVIALDDLSPIDLGWVSENAREARRHNENAASDLTVAAERGQLTPVNTIGGATDRHVQAVASAKCSEDQAAATTVALLDLVTLRAAVDVPAGGSTPKPVPAVVTSTGTILPRAANSSTSTLLAPVILATANDQTTPGQASATTNRGSNNPKTRNAARTGQEAHRQIEARLAELGFDTEVPIILEDGTLVRKDAIKGNLAVIIKPDTPTGRLAAEARAKLMRANNWSTEIIYYNPADPAYQPGSPTYIGPRNH
ncbi:MAG TPA: RHS repeat-associated core domain-containing protein [Thermoanaerobaculia bacterium]